MREPTQVLREATIGQNEHAGSRKHLVHERVNKRTYLHIEAQLLPDLPDKALLRTLPYLQLTAR